MNATIDGEPFAFEYNEMQEDTFNTLTQQYQFIILCKGRRAGGTIGGIQYIIEQSLCNSLSVLWVDTIQKNLIPLYSRYFLPYLRKLMPQYYEYRRNSHELDLMNSTIYFRSAERPESMEGFFYDIIVLNESGLILKGQRGRNLWYNTLYPMTIDRKATCLFIGTPKGKKAKKNERTEYSLYYELYLKGQEKNKNWISVRYGSHSNLTFLAQEQMKAAKNRGRKLTFKKALKSAKDSIEELAESLPSHIVTQEIDAEFIDRQEETIIHEEWFQFVSKLPDVRMHEQTLISMDTAFKIGELNDCSAAIVVTKTTDGNYYISDMINDKFEFPQLVQTAKDLATRNPNATYMLIEDKASGQSLIQVLRQETDIKVKAIKVTKDKLTRVNSITKIFKDNKVHLVKGDWNRELINQLCAFNGLFDSPDDIVDCLSQALNYLNTKHHKNVIVHKKVVRTSKVLQGYN